MIVELAGLPGSGKTWQRDRLRAALHRRFQPSPLSPRVREPPQLPSWLLAATPDFDFLQRAALMAQLGVSCLHYRGVFVSALPALVQGRRQWRDKTLAFRLLGVTLDNYRLLQNMGSDASFVLFDEGLVQRAFTIFVDNDGTTMWKHLECYIAAVPCPDLIVYLSVDPQRCISRLRSRPRGLPLRFQPLQLETVEEILTAGGRFFDHLLDRLQTFGNGPRVIRIDANDFAGTSREIDERVLPILHQSSARQPAEGTLVDEV